MAVLSVIGEMMALSVMLPMLSCDKRHGSTRMNAIFVSLLQSFRPVPLLVKECTTTVFSVTTELNLQITSAQNSFNGRLVTEAGRRCCRALTGAFLRLLLAFQQRDLLFARSLDDLVCPREL